MNTPRIALLLMLAVLAFPVVTFAQITPPGLGYAETAAWSALGVKQALGGSERFEYLGYAGIGSTSDPHDANPYRNANIFVLNQEIYDRFAQHWLYSLAFSYRRQDAREGHDGALELRQLQEFRGYARYGYVRAWGRLKLLNTVRPELRGFVAPDFGVLEQPFQFRFRLKTQLTCSLDRSASKRLVVAAEELASISRTRDPAARWTDFNYRESRFSLFYSFNLGEHSVVEVGYMNNLIGNRAALVDVHYLAFDIVWLNPFARPRRPSEVPHA